MKSLRSLFLSLALCLGLLSGCASIEDPSGVRSEAFYTTVKGLTFYFVDETGKDCIMIDQPSTWPLTFARVIPAAERQLAISQVKSTADAAGRPVYQYNDMLNSIVYDQDEQLWGFQCYFWGQSPKPQCSTYLFLGDLQAEMVVTYQYIDQDGLFSNGSMMVQVTSVTFNGTEVLRGNSSGKVYVRISAAEGAITANLHR